MRVERYTQFKRDVSRAKKQGKDLSLLKTAIETLLARKRLPPKYNDHGLKGKYQQHRDCHLESDWLLIYRISNDTLRLERLGSHSELFK